MEPMEAVAALVPIASEVKRTLLFLAAPRLHARFREELPVNATTADLRALFDRFAVAARALDEHGGLLGGTAAFVRTARTLQKLGGEMTGWHPKVQDPPMNVVEIARVALRHLGTTEPDGGWDAFDDQEKAAE